MPALRRRLEPEEIIELRKVFGDSLPWKKLRIRGRNIRGEDLAYTRLPRREKKMARMVTVDRDYVRSLRAADGQVDDLYARSLGPLPEGPLLVHEVMHAWLDAHRSGRRTGGTDAQADLLGLPSEALYDMAYWLDRGVPFDRWPEEAKANAAVWFWNGLYHDASDPKQAWYVRVPMIDRLFEHIRVRGELPAWASTEPVARFGALRGFDNPGNWLIEAFRQETGRLDRDLLLTYRDADDPDVIEECAAEVDSKAKRLGRKPSDYKSDLRAGMRTWYR